MWLLKCSANKQYDTKLWGTGADGVLNVTNNMTISGGIKNYTSINIASGKTLTISGNAVIHCSVAFNNAGTVVVAATGGGGGKGGTGTWWYSTKPTVGGAGNIGGAGGKGGRASYRPDSYGIEPKGENGANGGVANGSLPTTPEAAISAYNSYKGGGGGGGGGFDDDYHEGRYSGMDGGKGAGGLVIAAFNFKNSGTIKANGANGTPAPGGTYYWQKGPGAGGGGGGGVIVIITHNNQQTGTLNVNGGTSAKGGWYYEDGPGELELEYWQYSTQGAVGKTKIFIVK